MVWTARCRDADREKGRASSCQVGLPAQSLLCRRFRRVVRAFICTFGMRVFIYVYVCMCTEMIYYIIMYTVYTYACVYVFVHLCVYTRVYVYVYACLCIDCGFWYQCFSVWTVSCMRMCFRVHMHAYTYMCRYIYMCIFLQ